MRIAAVVTGALLVTITLVAGRGWQARISDVSGVPWRGRVPTG